MATEVAEEHKAHELPDSGQVTLACLKNIWPEGTDQHSVMVQSPLKQNFT